MAAYLVLVDGMRGPEPQVWHSDGNRFVGPPLIPLKKVELPHDGPWSIGEALQFLPRERA